MPSASMCLHERGDGVGPGLVGRAGALVPHHHGEEDADAAAVEVGDHLANAFDAAGHGLDHLQLVAVVDAHVWIGGPDEHGVDAAVAFFEIVEIAVDGVAAGDGVIEVAVLDHHLRLDEAGLGPLERGQFVARWVEGGADAALGAPVLRYREASARVRWERSQLWNAAPRRGAGSVQSGAGIAGPGVGIACPARRRRGRVRSRPDQDTAMRALTMRGLTIPSI